MSDFDTQLLSAAQKSILKVITEGKWLNFPYDSKVKVPKNILDEVWSLIDTDKLKQQLARRIEAELADRLLNHLAAEMATDIKQILSVTERREALRSIARQHIESVLALGELK